jgi:transposase
MTCDAILVCSFRGGSLIKTAKLNGVDPQHWLTDVLGRIADHKITKLDELMPWRYAQD